ncbi:MAG: hypothetical protein CFH43_00068 [Proteobacteria bacterium]|nr:MAG: hypothetical protein CFH43_00068 [Pseudomonadota bacterium]
MADITKVLNTVYDAGTKFGPARDIVEAYHFAKDMYGLTKDGVEYVKGKFVDSRDDFSNDVIDEPSR